MLKVIDFITQYWQQLTLIMLFLFLFAFVKPIVDFLRSVKDGLKEIFNPLGFFVFLVLILFGIFIYFFFQGTFR